MPNERYPVKLKMNTFGRGCSVHLEYCAEDHSPWSVVGSYRHPHRGKSFLFHARGRRSNLERLRDAVNAVRWGSSHNVRVKFPGSAYVGVMRIGTARSGVNGLLWGVSLVQVGSGGADLHRVVLSAVQAERFSIILSNAINTGLE